MIGRIAIEDVTPSVSCGTRPARAVVGETMTVGAAVFRDGHDAVGANVVVRGPDGADRPSPRMAPGAPGTDRWEADVLLDAEGLWSFVIEAWDDPLSTWQYALTVKVAAAQDVTLELEEGALLLETAAKRLSADEGRLLVAAAETLRDSTLDVAARAAPASDPELAAVLRVNPLRWLLTRSEPYPVWVDRQRALYGSWYEFFPRSEGASLDPPKSGTFRTAMERLPAIADMGFDVVYLPPIHPIGRSFRKGPNNTLTAGPDDPGSPWAIGSADGGHDAVHPDLGTIEDFDAFVARTRELGMEVALDFALQCSPDHPWATEHPEWFTVRADGSIAYAENPPKKYQDIYPLNFNPVDFDREEPAREQAKGLHAEILRVLRHWMAHDVRLFRVDNPHTKPLNFWEELIGEVKKTDPDVLFLAEAFTRPAMMHALAKIGFTQSYTYFTWRTGKDEIRVYAEELSGRAADYMRPNFFVNTPDILHATLQYGGPPMFKIRAVLAALLSPTWGVYSGYELYESTPVRPGSEEYLDSEKYQYRPRDWSRPDSLAWYLKRLNELRRRHPALQWLRNLSFHEVDSPEMLAFSKRTGSGPDADVVLVVVSLDPYLVREATVTLDMAALGLSPDERFIVRDEITGEHYEWGRSAYVRLNPFDEPAHVLAVERPAARRPPAQERGA